MGLISARTSKKILRNSQALWFTTLHYYYQFNVQDSKSFLDTNNRLTIIYDNFYEI